VGSAEHELACEMGGVGGDRVGELDDIGRCPEARPLPPRGACSSIVEPVRAVRRSENGAHFWQR
jgi:hypothetical protein